MSPLIVPVYSVTCLKYLMGGRLVSARGWRSSGCLVQGWGRVVSESNKAAQVVRKRLNIGGVQIKKSTYIEMQGGGNDEFFGWI